MPAEVDRATAHRIASLETEVESLRQELEQSRKERGHVDGFPFAWRLTPSEKILLAMLSSRQIATKGAILDGLYYGRGRAEPDQKTIDVFVCMLRKKMLPLGVAFETVWGRGWAMTAAQKAALAAAIERAQLEEAS